MSNHLNEEFLRNNPGEPVPYPFEPINPSPNKKVSLKRKNEEEDIPVPYDFIPLAPLPKNKKKKPKREKKPESPSPFKQIYLPNIFT
jgi:hypothetical protein